MPEMSQTQAEEVLEMFAEGEGLESVNTSLALHLVDLARELGRDALVSRLLDHAAKVSVNPEDQGWCQFELLKHNGASKDELIGLGMVSENEGLPWSGGRCIPSCGLNFSREVRMRASLLTVRCDCVKRQMMSKE
jgi:hypothetical protein